jgi:hypothetical protein
MTYWRPEVAPVPEGGTFGWDNPPAQSKTIFGLAIMQRFA